MTNKITFFDYSTKEATREEVQRICDGFQQRVCSFFERNNINIECSMVINPNLLEYNNLRKLKQGIYCFLSRETVELLSPEQTSDLIEKLRFFSFNEQGINNLLFVIGNYAQIQNDKQDMTEIAISDLWIDDRIKLSFYTNIESIRRKGYRGFICFTGASGSGKTACAISIAHELGCSYKIITNRMLFSTGIEKMSKLYETPDSQTVFIFENIDYLFSDYKIKNSSIDLTCIREKLLSIYNERNLVFIFTLDSSDYIPSQYLSNIDSIIRLEEPSYNLRKSIFGKIVKDKTILFDLCNKTQGYTLKRVLSIADNVSQNQSLDWIESICTIENLRNEALANHSKTNYKIEVPNISLKNVALPEKSLNLLINSLSAISHMEYLQEELGWNEIDPNARCIINFYGPPGTGKTMTARALVSELSKMTGSQYELMSLNYSEIESKYVGDAPKNLENAFNYARNRKVVMFFDEADSFLGKRITNVTQGSDQAINSLRSTMLIQLESFTGVVIFATNLTCNYDKAFKTRFLTEIEFKLPDEDTLAKIIEYNIPQKLKDNTSLWTDKINHEGYVALAKSAIGLSGRDIRNIIKRTLLKKIGLKYSIDDFEDEIKQYVDERSNKPQEGKVVKPLPPELDKAIENATTSVNDDCRKLKEKLNY